jgi:polyphosphate:AMP phosphotransferase
VRNELTKAELEKQLPAVRDALLTAQARMRADKSFALVLIMSDVPAAGRSEIVNQFLEWIDPKFVRVEARLADGPKPVLRECWGALPARGEIGIFFAGWYEDYFRKALFAPRKNQKRAVERIRKLEVMLPHDRVRVVKVHLGISHKTQRKRIDALLKNKLARWRVTREDRWLVKHHGRVERTLARCLRATDSKLAPWHVIDGSDAQYRLLAAGKLLVAELEAGLKAPTPKASRAAKALARGSVRIPTHQSGTDVDDEAYDSEIAHLQSELGRLVHRDAFAKRGAVFAFEGMDAAGKGGAIRRITMVLDARRYSVVPISAPTAEELAHPYLWRFWRRLPERGELTIFDRSWYGRVLVERVRGFAAAPDWRRAYEEINEFELEIAESGFVVHKFWLAVSKQAQLARFEERDHDPLKRFKVDPEDWKNRKLYDDYMSAARDMLARTNTKHAPWTVVPADDKKYARLAVLRAAVGALR